jgi:putative nucleotidyltransferase with HDIG domain
MTTDQELVVDEAKVKRAIQSGIPLTITSFTLPHAIEVYIERILTVFLRQVEQEKLKDYISYCIQELTVNAKKANTKRVYFMERGLDLGDSEDYKEGMAVFKEQTLGNIAHYLQLQKEKGLYIRLVLHMKNNIICIEVRNNVTMTKTELIRIHDRLVRARQFKNLEEAMNQVLDDSEGAGLGLVILVLMLKKMGLDEDCFDITVSEKETIARLIIPLDQTRVENLSALSGIIVDNINSLPQFPDHLLKLQNLITDPKSEMAAIGQLISMDPALTADLLKAVNSAQYMPAKKIDNISEAVRMVGMLGIKSLLYSYGSQKVLGDDTANKKELWNHSYKTAFFAFNLAKNFRHNRELLDDAYVGGILHDMGKIIFTTVRPELSDKIKNFCSEKGLPVSTFEDLAAGMNHAAIGALIADKWNFPERLAMCIRYHHDPVSAPKDFKELVNIVYLANMLCELETGNVSYEQLEPSVLDSLGITSEKQVHSLLEKFSAGFEKEGKTRQQSH